MLSETYTKRTGIFNYQSLSVVLSRIKKTGITSEMDDMLLTAVISTHLLYHQFVEGQNSEYLKRKLSNLKVIEG